MSTYDMQDEIIRRRVFWMLQRLTSWSLWKAKRDAFKRFLDAYEAAVKSWPANDSEIVDADSLEVICEILNDFDKGIAELAKGERFVWRVEQPLERAVNRFAELASSFYRHPRYWEHGGQIAPYPPKVDALYQAMRASQFQLDDAPLEVWSRGKIANLESPDVLLDPDGYDHGFYKLGYPKFPVFLPAVPNPSGPVIFSGEDVPFDGIWEPVDIAFDQGRLLKSVGGNAKNNGCFNYFVAETEAPNISSVDDATLQLIAEPTCWRLLWRDERYRDGVIGDESQFFLKSDDEPVASPAIEAPLVRTSDICPHSGEWRTDEYGGKTISVERGATMPDMLVRGATGELIVHWVTWRLIKKRE
ncbi:Imm72 family immunity protein [Burkholderia gladioli]|uniref:Imm72 family immunity protein n=1 Tax=Burkholderia gladioli TaxID=28095 RepID=UPI00163EB4D3|nr:Imm72 family immunity protein [Burkholderia gladioli]